MFVDDPTDQNKSCEISDVSKQAQDANIQDETRSPPRTHPLLKKQLATKIKRVYQRQPVRNKKFVARLKKDEQVRRDEREKWICQMRDQAEQEIAILKSSVVGEAGPSGATCAPSFSDDLIDDIRSLTPPIELSQE